MPNFRKVVTVASLCLGVGLIGYSAVSAARIKGVLPERNASFKETFASFLPSPKEAPKSELYTVLPASLEGCTEAPEAQTPSQEQDQKQRDAAARLLAGATLQKAGLDAATKVYVCGDQKIAVLLTRRPDAAKMGFGAALAVKQAGVDPLQRERAFMAAMSEMNPVFAEVDGVAIRFDVEAMDHADEDRRLRDGGVKALQESLAAGHPLQAKAYIGDRYEFSLVSDASEDVIVDFLSRVQFARLVEAAEAGGVLAPVAPEEADIGIVKRFTSMIGIDADDTTPTPEEPSEPAYVSECRMVNAKKVCSIVRAEP
nr:hypothetical protein [uncultured Celeribacter sp.]